MPPPIQQFLTLPDLLDSVHIGLNVTSAGCDVYPLDRPRCEVGRGDRADPHRGMAFVKQMIVAQGTMSMRVGDDDCGESHDQILEPRRRHR